ncbi:hypothetical protein CVT24_006458 [Panaeolus cyanescens]|uniref:DUF1479 domain protein n=1 Tax=Panaeolus cyanescens TaxID=181874 RepID=A0A409VZB4_9AGAR|nr:hypothetical protein CVT24_006458 [Panaeolus cyanescens]
MILSRFSGTLLLFPGKRGLATVAPHVSSRKAKAEGSIAAIFTSLTDENHVALPDRFAELKRDLWNEGLVQSWKEVLGELESEVEHIAARGAEIIPKVSYRDIKSGLSKADIDTIKRVGTVIVQGGVPQEEALAWKQSIVDYAANNKDLVKGFPSDNIQVYEIYNSVSQIKARTHPNIVDTQRFLLSLWNTSDPTSEISLQTPISYFDRLRIRLPGDAKFTLGPHIDGGSVERWEDVGLRSVFGKILQGGSSWKSHNPFDASPRIGAKQDMYHTSNACSIFRAWQGWTSLSSTGPGEGTLRVFPNLSLATAYLILRPFFRPRHASSTSLKADDWVLDVESSTFPGSSIGKTQELNEKTHPHLQLARTMTSVPKVEPGDQVYWHCDVIHAVEGKHGGKGDSSVLYIPTVPLTIGNASYLRDQRINFLAGLPAPDFPGGEGETRFMGRGTPDDVLSEEGRRMLGLEIFEADAGKGLGEEFVRKINEVLI